MKSSLADLKRLGFKGRFLRVNLFHIIYYLSRPVSSFGGFLWKYLQGGGLIWFPPYMVWLLCCMKGYDSSIIILKNGHNLGSEYHFLMKL